MSGRRMAAWLLMALSLTAQAAVADGFDYTGVEAGYNLVRPGDGHAYTGWYVAGTYQLPPSADSWSLSGAYYSASGRGETQASTFAGLNYHWPMSDRCDLVGDLFYRRDTVTSAASSDAAVGYAVDAGLHLQLSEAMDVNAVVGHQALTQGGLNFLQVSPAVDLGGHLSLSLAWQHLSDASNQFTMGIRYEF